MLHGLVHLTVFACLGDLAGAQAEEPKDAAGSEGEAGACRTPHHHIWDAHPEQPDGDARPVRHCLPGECPPTQPVETMTLSCALHLQHLQNFMDLLVELFHGFHKVTDWLECSQSPRRVHNE